MMAENHHSSAELIHLLGGGYLDGSIDRLLTSIVKVQIVHMACIVMNVKSLYIYVVVDIAW